MIITKRAYDTSAPSDGYRVLVDRLWPRGLSKAKAQVDLWAKDVAPSNELREWYGHDPDKWPEFRRRYLRELRGAAPAAVLAELVRRSTVERVTLVYASRAADISNAAVLERLLTRRAEAAMKK